MMFASAVVDFQGFKTEEGSLLVKELTIIDTIHAVPWHWIFRPPTDQKISTASLKCNRWAKKNLHGIDWSHGDYSYEDLKKIVSGVVRGYSFIWGKGAEKCKFIEDLVGQAVYDLHNFNCPNLKSLENDKVSCHYHLDMPNYVCSYNQAQRLARWIRQNPQAVDFMKEDVRRNTFGGENQISDLLPFNGFIRGYDKEARCIYCGLTYKTESPINVFDYHMENSPNCPWFKEHHIPAPKTHL